MAKTEVNLFRSVIDERFKIRYGEYPGDGVLDPRWKDSIFIDRKGRERVSRADVFVSKSGPHGPLPHVHVGGGTSLHDVPRWYSYLDFWIPEGTEYSDEDIYIRRDKDLRVSPYNPKITGYHYQLEPKRLMTVLSFQGALDKMARAAIVRQIALAKSNDRPKL